MDDGPRRIRGHPAPLFDRLGAAATAAPANAVLDIDALALAVERGLKALVATRAAGVTPTIMAYGVPDTLAYPASDPAARVALAQRIADAVRRFEPRLAGPRVRIEPRPARAGTAVCHIEGELRHGPVMRRVGFHLDLEVSDLVADGG